MANMVQNLSGYASSMFISTDDTILTTLAAKRQTPIEFLQQVPVPEAGIGLQTEIICGAGPTSMSALPSFVQQNVLGKPLLSKIPAEQVRLVMRKVPQPVVVVTTADNHIRRGVTVSSFTPITLQPEPLVSFCVRIPSRASDLLHSAGGMVVNMLSHEQVQQSVAFSSPNKTDQFKDIPFYDDPSTGLPVLMGTIGSMHCKALQVLKLGDHELWITRVIKVDHGVGSKHGRREEAQPLLYHDRRYRSVGEQVFMKAFEDSMDPKLWTHRAHIRMAWNYLRELGKEKAEPVIKETIRRHFVMNPSKNLVYHETITTFYIHLVDLAIKSHNASTDDEEDFFEFLESFPVLTSRNTIHKYYSPELLKSEKARKQFVLPDLAPLPSTIAPSKLVSQIE